MRGIHKGIIAIAVVIVVTGFVYFQYFSDTLGGLRKEPMTPPPVAKKGSGTPTTPPPVTSKTVNATVSYEVPGDKVDHLNFVVTVDAAGAIQEIKTLDAETGEIPEKKKEFNEQVNVILKGKKLSELTKIDKVGKSTLTTAAFNDAIDDLQAKL